MKIIDSWITVNETIKLTKLSRPTVLSYCKKGVFECKKAVAGQRSPWWISLISIPSYLRKESDTI